MLFLYNRYKFIMSKLSENAGSLRHKILEHGFYGGGHLRLFALLEILQHILIIIDNQQKNRRPRSFIFTEKLGKFRYISKAHKYQLLIVTLRCDRSYLKGSVAEKHRCRSLKHKSFYINIDSFINLCSEYIILRNYLIVKLLIAP